MAMLLGFMACVSSSDPVEVAAPSTAPSLAASSPAAWPRSPRWARIDDATLARTVTPHLAAGESLAHDVYQGPLGPRGDVIFALTTRGSDVPPEAAFRGFVLLAGDPTPTRVELPRLAAEWMPDEVAAVLFEDVDNDGQDEAIVLATYLSGAGPGGAVPFQSNAVLDFDGITVRRLPAIEERIAALGTAAKVRAALK